MDIGHTKEIPSELEVCACRLQYFILFRICGITYNTILVGTTSPCNRQIKNEVTLLLSTLMDAGKNNNMYV